MLTIYNMLLYFFNKEIPIVSNIVTIIILFYLFFVLKNIYIESLTKVVIKFALLLCLYLAMLGSVLVILYLFTKQL